MSEFYNQEIFDKAKKTFERFATPETLAAVEKERADRQGTVLNPTVEEQINVLQQIVLSQAKDIENFKSIFKTLVTQSAMFGSWLKEHSDEIKYLMRGMK